MLYRRLSKLKEDTQSITDLEVAHWYLRLLESTPTLHAKFLQQVFFSEFGDSYTLLDVYNISEKLELAHAHYEANTMRPPSRSRPQPPRVAPTRSSHFSSRAKVVHSASPILLFDNYCGNPAHKVSECNIPPRISFVIIVGKRDIKKLFVLPSFQNGSNSDYHDKTC
jgi:hypothetical protein